MRPGDSKFRDLPRSCSIAGDTLRSSPSQPWHLPFFVFKTLTSTIFRPCPLQTIPSLPVFVHERRCKPMHDRLLDDLWADHGELSRDVVLKHFSQRVWNKTNVTDRKLS